mmetsp:Transcript_12082/g.18664  ORF Transcript_12082/g.18664 Transcript_12082/m.18664 type:complete len:139 (-) Transcript_12082:486-902(-)
MPVPLCTSSYFCLNDEGEADEMSWPEVTHIFNKELSLISFKIQNPSKEAPQGCSDLLNGIFKKNFQTHSGSLVDQKAIQIAFDFDYEQQDGIVMADAHGVSSLSEMERLAHLFDTIIINYEESYGNDREEELLKMAVD